MATVFRFVTTSVLLAATCFAVRSEAATIRVPQDFATIQAAIQAAQGGDTVEVAAGTYMESIDFLGKAITVTAVGAVEATVIDGSSGGATVTFQNGETPSSVLEGFTIRGGNGAVVGTSTIGGGIYVFAASPTIRGNEIRQNVAFFGGGIGCLGNGQAVIESNRIVSNRAEISQQVQLGRGGGIYCSDSAAPFVIDNEIVNNISQFRGGGIFTDLSAGPFLEGNVIAGNQTGVEGAGLAVMAGSNVIAGGNEFRANISGVRGGAVHVEEATLRATENLLHENRCGQYGGAVSLVTGTDETVFDRNRMLRNVADQGGGAIYVTNARPTFRGNLVAFNEAGCGEATCGGGGLFASTGARPLLINSTYFGNTSEAQGGAVFSFAVSRPVIVNGIFWNNRGAGDAEITVDISDILVETSIVRGGWPGTGNLDADPRFVDGDAGDFHLRLGSPAVDTGAPRSDLGDVDLDGDPRIVDGDPSLPLVVDRGADELRREIAARYGTVGAAAGRVESILTVNGSAGDVERRVVVAAGAPIFVDLAAPSAGPMPAGFALYLYEDEPDVATVSKLPQQLGTSGFPFPIRGGQPRFVWNTLGHEPKLGTPDFPAMPAPTRVVDAPGGTGLQVRVTLQGLVLDDGSAANVAGSLTNAVVLEIQ